VPDDDDDEDSGFILPPELPEDEEDEEPAALGKKDEDLGDLDDVDVLDDDARTVTGEADMGKEDEEDVDETYWEKHKRLDGAWFPDKPLYVHLNIPKEGKPEEEHSELFDMAYGERESEMKNELPPVWESLLPDFGPEEERAEFFKQHKDEILQLRDLVGDYEPYEPDHVFKWSESSYAKTAANPEIDVVDKIQWPKNKYMRIKFYGWFKREMNLAEEALMEAIKSCTGLKAGNGAARLPTKIKRFCVLRSPFVDKDARETFEIRQHTRIIDIYLDEELLNGVSQEKERKPTLMMTDRDVLDQGKILVMIQELHDKWNDYLQEKGHYGEDDEIEDDLPFQRLDPEDVEIIGRGKTPDFDQEKAQELGAKTFERFLSYRKHQWTKMHPRKGLVERKFKEFMNDDEMDAHNPQMKELISTNDPHSVYGYGGTVIQRFMDVEVPPGIGVKITFLDKRKPLKDKKIKAAFPQKRWRSKYMQFVNEWPQKQEVIKEFFKLKYEPDRRYYFPQSFHDAKKYNLEILTKWLSMTKKVRMERIKREKAGIIYKPEFLHTFPYAGYSDEYAGEYERFRTMGRDAYNDLCRTYVPGDENWGDEVEEWRMQR